MCCWQVPGLSQKRNAGLPYSILAAVSFKIVSLGTYTVSPSYFVSFRSIMEVIFLIAVEYGLRFPLDVRHCFKTSSLQFQFSIWETKRNHSPASREDGGTITMLLLVTNSVVFKEVVGGRVVVMKEQRGSCSDFWLRSSGKLHNLSHR
jgi:hypothetical protein